MKSLLLLILIFMLTIVNAQAKIYKIIKKNGTVVHTHSIDEQGNYPYTDQEILTRLGFDDTYIIETAGTLPQDAIDFNDTKNAEADAEKEKEAKIEAEMRKLAEESLKAKGEL